MRPALRSDGTHGVTGPSTRLWRQPGDAAGKASLSAPALANGPRVCHGYGMIATVKLDRSNRIVLSRDLRRAAGIPRGQKLRVSATPGRVVLEVEPNAGKVVKRGKLKVWTGQVPSTPIEEAVEVVRHYER